MENNYLQIKADIEKFLETIENDEEVSEKLKKYFKGIQVFFSPLVHKPKFMFIGINSAQIVGREN